VVRDTRQLPLVLTTFTSMTCFSSSVCDIFEGDCAFHILSRKDGLVFPFHKDLDV
jgi:hypothetical protein